MIPQIIQAKLAGLRGRERLLTLAWGMARWLAIVLVLLLAAGFVDWLLDRDQDTPWLLRWLLFLCQISVAVGAGAWLVLWPLAKRANDAALSLRVEDRYPELGHRLITAVELNRPDADTLGMSQELIGLVTRQAEEQAHRLDFSAVADHRRLKWSVVTLGSALVAFALPFLLCPGLAVILLGRQFLVDQDIPRSVVLEVVRADDVWPSGEKGVLQVRARGLDLDVNRNGYLTIRPEGQKAERLQLDFASSAHPGEAIFRAQVPAGGTSFSYTARLGDGRLRRPGLVRYEPRPIVTDVLAWVVLPKFCGTDANGDPYEQPQARGDIVAIAGSSARIILKTQKPIKTAYLELIGPEKADDKGQVDGVGPETCKRRIDLTASTIRLEGSAEEIHLAEGAFDLRPDETAYRAVVIDAYDFVNQSPPRRKLFLVDEDKPQVTLLREQFPPSSGLLGADQAEDFEVEGLPVPLGKDIRIGYVAHGPYGLGRANLLFRVVKKLQSGNDEIAPNPWIALPLPELLGTDKTGPFNPRLGVFQNSGQRDQVFFHAVPDPGPILPRSLGGGRFDLKTTGIPDGAGGYLKLKVGDQIEYCVEVFADKDAKAKRPSNRSETRFKTIVSEGDFALWISDSIQEERRIRQLDAKQRGLFDDK